MAVPCLQEGRIVKVETLVEEHGKKLDSIDGKLDTLIEMFGDVRARQTLYESAPFQPSNSYVAGIATVGAMLGGFVVTYGKQIAKPLLGLLGVIVK